MNPVVHFEMPYADRARMARFYEQAFGWQSQMLGPDMGDYVVVTTTPTVDGRPQEPGAINGGFFARNPDLPPQQTAVVVSVEDIEAAMRQVTQSGGKVLTEPMPIPGVGTYVSCADTEGNRIGLLQPQPVGAMP